MGSLDYERNESEQSVLDIFMPAGAPTTIQRDPMTGDEIKSEPPSGLHGYDDIYRCDGIIGGFLGPGEFGQKRSALV